MFGCIPISILLEATLLHSFSYHCCSSIQVVHCLLQSFTFQPSALKPRSPSAIDSSSHLFVHLCSSVLSYFSSFTVPQRGIRIRGRRNSFTHDWLAFVNIRPAPAYTAPCIVSLYHRIFIPPYKMHRVRLCTNVYAGNCIPIRYIHTSTTTTNANSRPPRTS